MEIGKNVTLQMNQEMFDNMKNENGIVSISVMKEKKEHKPAYQLKQIDKTLTQLVYASIAHLDQHQMEWFNDRVKEVDKEYKK